MKRNEAYEILGLSSSANDDDIKKAFRKLASECHPDRNNGSKESEDKFKKINQAYQILTDKEQAEDDKSNFVNQNTNINDIIMDFFSSTGNFSDPFAGSPYGSNPFEQFFTDPNKNQKNRIKIDLSPINISLSLSFEESILGCNKKISFQKKIYCKDCNGFGKKRDNNKACSKCNGAGQFRTKISNGIFISMQARTCEGCNGLGYTTINCDSCNGLGHSIANESLNVKIPAIGGEEVKLAISQRGHSFAGRNGDVLISVHPTTIGSNEHSNMHLEGKDVHVRVCVDLYTLLYGGNIKIPAIGYNDIDFYIKELTKPADKFIISGKGVKSISNRSNGNYVITFDVKYPNKEKLSKELLEELKKSYEQ